MKVKERSFGAKLYSMFIGSVLIPVAIAMAVFLLYSIRVLLDQEEKNARNILNSVSQNIELQFSRIEEVRSMFYINKEVFQEAERLNNPDLYAYYDEYVKTSIENAYTGVFTRIMYTSLQNVCGVVFFPVSGKDHAYYLGKSRARLTEITYPGYQETDWFQEAVDEPRKFGYHAPHLPEYSPNKKLGQVYSVIFAVWDNDKRKAIGVVKVDVDAKDLYESLNMLTDTKDSGLLLAKDGKVFAKSEEPAGEARITGKNQITVGTRKYHAKLQEIPDTELKIVYLHSLPSVYGGYLYVILFSVSVVLFGLGLGFISYRYQAKKMVEDIGEITAVVQQVEKGNLDVFICIEDESEFGKVAEVINQMIKNLQEYIEKEYILTIQHQKARYQALQAQINPHFLYNTLNGFVALNRMGERRQLERSITGLSKLFRYACSSRETASICDELAFLEEYLNLEKLKYDGRLEYLIWMDEACRQREIPKLLLQPIVENSIVHGMGDTDQPIMLQIAASCMEVKGIGPVTVIMIRDNGVGFEKSSARNPKERVGTMNVQMRTELYCRQAIYQCVSEVGVGTKTTFVFPEER